MELLAKACGLNPQGGSAAGQLFRVRDSEPKAGAQAVVATHSPIVAAVPGAVIWELGDWGIRTSRWEDLHIVGAWKGFLADPGLYVRYLLNG